MFRFILFIQLLLLVSCSEEAKKVEDKDLSTAVVGTWKVIDFSVSSGVDNETLKKHEFIYEFTKTSYKLIKRNIQTGESRTRYEGTYSFKGKVVTFENSKTPEDKEMFPINIQGNILTIEEREWPHYFAKMERVK